MFDTQMHMKGYWNNDLHSNIFLCLKDIIFHHYAQYRSDSREKTKINF